jgi:hypothetical protein
MWIFKIPRKCTALSISLIYPFHSYLLFQSSHWDGLAFQLYYFAISWGHLCIRRTEIETKSSWQTIVCIEEWLVLVLWQLFLLWQFYFLQVMWKLPTFPLFYIHVYRICCVLAYLLTPDGVAPASTRTLLSIMMCHWRTTWVNLINKLFGFLSGVTIAFQWTNSHFWCFK